MYTDLFPNIVTTIIRLKSGIPRGDSKATNLLEQINQKFLRAIIEILGTRSNFEFIFKRLKKEFFSEARTSAET